MKQVHLLGYWMSSLADSRYSLPQDVVGELGETTRRIVAAYLRKGVVYQSYRGHSWCRFLCGAEPAALGSDELTDGRWVWPRGLAHYVEKHHVLLPDPFLTHVRSGGSTVSSLEGLPEPTDDLWVTWCSQRSSGAHRASIEAARGLAAAREHAIRETRIRDFEIKKGLSERPCASSGCGGKAANGWNLCPRCALDAGGGAELEDGDFPGRPDLYLREALMAARSAFPKDDPGPSGSGRS